jgi:hypothetical protein
MIIITNIQIFLRFQNIRNLKKLKWEKFSTIKLSYFSHGMAYKMGYVYIYQY